MDPVVITPDSQYNSFLNTLPLNQRLTQEEEYSTHRYWELNDKPSDFNEAKNIGMYSLEDDGTYHANSVQLTKSGDYEWMKPKHHSTAHMELDWYNSAEGADFKKQYRLVDDENRPGFYKYEKRVKLPKYEDGKEPVAYQTKMPKSDFQCYSNRISDKSTQGKYLNSMGNNQIIYNPAALFQLKKITLNKRKSLD